jgi:hypothetical protein
MITIVLLIFFILSTIVDSDITGGLLFMLFLVGIFGFGIGGYCVSVRSEHEYITPLEIFKGKQGMIVQYINEYDRIATVESDKYSINIAPTNSIFVMKTDDYNSYGSKCYTDYSVVVKEDKVEK